MSKKAATPEVDFAGIPHGLLTLEQFMDSSDGQEVIQTMKSITSDPYSLIVPCLISYQYYDLLAHLNDKAIPMKEERKNDEALLDLATRYVVEYLPNIVSDIGQERIGKLIQALSPDSSV